LKSLYYDARSEKHQIKEIYVIVGRYSSPEHIHIVQKHSTG